MMTHHDNINIHDLCEAVRAIPGATCDYDHPGYFAIEWKDRIYALGTINGPWEFDDADATDKFDIWESNSDAALPATATFEELVEFIKEYITFTPTKGKIHYCGGTSIVEIIRENEKSFTVINVGRVGLSSSEAGFDPRSIVHRTLRYRVAKAKLIPTK